MEELNTLFQEKCRKYLSHQIRGKEANVGFMLAQEKEYLYPLPKYPFDPCKRSTGCVDRFCTIRFDSNNYSVPCELCGREVSVKASPETVSIYLGGTCIAQHKRCLERKKTIYDLAHYPGYHNLPGEITIVGCWAHLRRKFDEAVKSLPKGKAKGSSASQGLAYCNLLFAIEQGLAEKNATAEDRYKERLEQAKPVLDAMFVWANSRTAAPKSALGKALTYLREQWPYLVNYLKDGRLEISNNRAERSMKPFVIDRKNFLFAKEILFVQRRN